MTFFEFTCQPLHVGELTTLGRELLHRLRATAREPTFVAIAHPLSSGEPLIWHDLPPDDANPFVSEDDAVFMRFDGLLIGNSDEHGEQRGVSIGFLWRHRIICFLRGEGPRLEAGTDAFYLRDIEGRQRVTLS